MPRHDSGFRKPSWLLLLLFALALAAPARADVGGFQLDRYEPTMPGSWFLSVEHPWYAGTRWFGAGLTLDYGRAPLVTGVIKADGRFEARSPLIEHQLVGHVDVAGSFFDWLAIQASLPVALVETGTAASGVAPVRSPTAGDPRISVWFRLFRQPDRDPFSIHLGGHVFIPIGAEEAHQGDAGARGMPKLVLAGLVANQLRWSATVGYLLRGRATIGAVDSATGSTAGQELQLGLAAQWTDPQRRFAVGPEANIATVTFDPAGGRSTFFQRESTSVELLGSGHAVIAKQLFLSVGVGAGLLRAPGTPDLRVLARIAWSPERVLDADHDGVPDAVDACPTTRGARVADNPRENGCPPDGDRDGIPDAEDRCPGEPRGDHADPARAGCPARDTDGDGLLDDADQCPQVAAGTSPDAARPGCPLPDLDSDGVPDAGDRCPDVAAGPHPDAALAGCPAPPAAAPEAVPAANADADGDTVPAPDDACPDQPGAPDPDAKKNGCPGLVVIRGGRLVTLAPVLFAVGKEQVLPASVPVLEAVARALKASPWIRRLTIEGHTEQVGNFVKNMALSDRRAKAVWRWLVQTGGVEPPRLSAKGFGSMRPIAPNDSPKGRLANRRIEFVISDPEVAPAPAPPAAKPPVKTIPSPVGSTVAPAKPQAAAKPARAAGTAKRRLRRGSR